MLKNMEYNNGMTTCHLKVGRARRSRPTTVDSGFKKFMR